MTVADPTDGPAVLPDRYKAVAILLMANFMNLIDVTIVNVALPTMQDSLNASSNMIEWIVAGYTFTFALLLLPSGRMGDIFGKRRMFIAGVGVFTAASTLCGLAPSAEWLVAARLIQGVGGAMMTPQTLALVPALFPPHERGGVFAFFAVAAGLASVSGPIVGGLLIGANIGGLDWRPIFLVNIPIGFLAIIGALRYVPPVKGDRDIGIDWVGIALAGLATLAILVPLIETAAIGWHNWMTASVVAAPFLGWAFVRWQDRQNRLGRPQLLPIRLMSEPVFLSGSILAGVLFSAVPGFFLVFALYLQQGFGLTPLQSGLTTTPFSVGVLAASPLSRYLADTHLKGRVIGGSLSIATGFAGVAVAMQMMVSGLHWVYTAPVLLLAGFGLGTTVSPLFQMALSAAEGKDSGSASGAVQSFQRLGNSFGVAIMGGIFFTMLGGADPGDHRAYTIAATAALVYPVIAVLCITAYATLRRISLSS